jgi:hypothetical protein
LNVAPVEVSLSGIGQTASGIIISPQQMSFTQPTLGQSSAAQTATITNTSSVAANGLVLSVSPLFTLVQNNCSSTLAAGASCSAGVIFTPTSNGVVTGALTVSSSAFVTAATLSLSGTGGAAGSIQVQPTSLNLPMTGVGNTSGYLAVTFTNNGSVSLAGVALSASSQFKLGSTNCGVSLDAGASCNAQVAFSPLDAGAQTGNLTFSSSSLAAPALVSLSGTGFDFSVSLSGQSSQTISSGQTASFAIKLAAMSGSSGTFTFACSGLPVNSACTFNPVSEVVTAGATGSATVQIATGVTSTSARKGNLPGYLPRGLLFACGLLLLPFAFRRKCKGIFWMVLLLAPFGMASCAGAGGGGGGSPPASGNKSTPAGTYSVVVAATANGLSHKITVGVTVD